MREAIEPDLLPHYRRVMGSAWLAAVSGLLVGVILIYTGLGTDRVVEIVTGHARAQLVEICPLFLSPITIIVALVMYAMGVRPLRAITYTLAVTPPYRVEIQVVYALRKGGGHYRWYVDYRTPEGDEQSIVILNPGAYTRFANFKTTADLYQREGQAIVIRSSKGLLIQDTE